MTTISGYALWKNDIIITTKSKKQFINFSDMWSKVDSRTKKMYQNYATSLRYSDRNTDDPEDPIPRSRTKPLLTIEEDDADGDPA